MLKAYVAPPLLSVIVGEEATVQRAITNITKKQFHREQSFFIL